METTSSRRWLLPPAETTLRSAVNDRILGFMWSNSITVSLPDGSERKLPVGSTSLDLAASVGSRLKKGAVAATVNGRDIDLTSELSDGDAVAIITSDTEEGRHVLRHSTAHVLAQAVTRLYPGAKFSIGPAIENGFYYDFDLPDDQTFSDEDLGRIETEMRRIVKENQPFVRSEHTLEEAKKTFADQPYKIEILERVENAAGDDLDAGEVAGDGVISAYRNTDDFIDMCVGPHVPSTGKLGYFKLQKVAGAHWRGNESGKMLQRLYGTAWESKQALAEHLHQLEEATRRDHRKLATELDLLSFPPDLGGGLAVWHPKGSIVRKLIEDYSRLRHERGGYEFVYTPHLAKSGVFETSGHLDWYTDSMYPPMEMDNGTYYMKPMNCPIHCLIYKSRQRSYRELPLRLFELGNVYRYERAGTLHGLLRIRGFTQDDSHIFVTGDQLADEITELLNFVLSVLRAFGFEDFTFNLATKDSNKYVGADDIWDEATSALREALHRHGLDYDVKDGDAAFYGPKIDIDVRDAIGRSWQLSTIQADFQLPERFNLEYVGADNDRHRPIMLHRALFGSIERFFGLLIEHYAGAFPTWLAPVQVRVLPVAEAHEEHAAEVVLRLTKAGVRVDLDGSDIGLGKRIRSAKLEKLPYILVVGDDDVAADTVGVNPRADLVSALPERSPNAVERDVILAEFIERFQAEVADAETAAFGA